MSPAQIALGIGIGLVSGLLAGLFGIGGGVVMTPGVQVLLGAPPIVALATPLPVVFPTAIAGSLRYRKAGEVDGRAAAWMMAAGIPAAIAGAWLTELVDTHLLLVVTAVLLGWQSVAIIRGGGRGGAAAARHAPTPRAFVLIGAVTGLTSGLLGVGGGIVMVPLMAGWLGMPLKRALGTSLTAIVGMVIPGTIAHAFLGNIDWAYVVVLTIGAVPGARIGAGLALGTRERALRVLVGGFMLLVACAYGIGELGALLGGGGAAATMGAAP